MEEAGSAGCVVIDREFLASAEELAVEDLELLHIQTMVL